LERAGVLRNKMLLISYHFPPDTAVGGLRARNFAKCLPGLGVDASILTVRHKGAAQWDVNDAKAQDGLKVLRAGTLPTLTDAYRGLKRLRRGSSRHGMSVAPLSSVSGGQAASGAAVKKMGRLRRYVLALFFALPDEEKNWILPALRATLREVRAGRADCILTTCPPYSVHLIGLLAKVITGVAWVADFRDPWMTTGSKRLYPTCGLSLWIERRLERQVVKRADLVTFNVQGLMRKYLERYSDMGEKKFIFIPNGFDPEVFSFVKALEKYSRFTLTYTGSLYLGRTPESVFAAVSRLIREGKIDKSKICIRLTGHCRYIGQSSVSELISSHGLEDVVDVEEPVPHGKALEIMARSHVALLFAPDQPYQIPAKVYEYMGAGVPVLALTKAGATRDLIESTKIGGAFAPEDEEGIMNFIYETFKGADGMAHHGEYRKVSQFHIETITGKLVRSLGGL